MSVKKLLCDKWEFSKNPIETEYSDSLDWKSVDIPHDWLIYDTENLYETSTGWYRRFLNADIEDGCRAYLRFEGVYMDCTVFVNGKGQESGSMATPPLRLILRITLTAGIT